LWRKAWIWNLLFEDAGALRIDPYRDGGILRSLLPLLPEDACYGGTSPEDIRVAVPRLCDWLEKVSWVTGGYVAATSVLTLYVGITSFRTHAKGVSVIVVLTGLSSVGWMAEVNFMIDSEYKGLLLLLLLLLLALAVLWSFALALFWFERSSVNL
jgi:hypothetical protein